MFLNLDLSNVIEKYREPFCAYIINLIKEKIINNFPFEKCIKMEDYIIENKLIDWQNQRDDYISVYNIYRLAVDNLKIKKISEDGEYKIYLDENINIPNSYTRLYPIVSLLEYGSLSIRGCKVLEKTMQEIADKITTHYNKFMLGV